MFHSPRNSIEMINDVYSNNSGDARLNYIIRVVNIHVLYMHMHISAVAGTHILDSSSVGIQKYGPL